MFAIRNIISGLILIVSTGTFANAQNISSFDNKKPSELLDSVITNYILEDTVKSVEFDKTNCTFRIEYSNRTITGTISNISSGNIKWRLSGGDLTLLLSSVKTKIAFYEFKSVTNNEHFATLYIHFDKFKIKQRTDFKNKVEDSFKQLIAHCKKGKDVF